MNWSENLSVNTVKPGKPWEFNDFSLAPEGLIDKRTRSGWITQPSSSWHCYSLWEGVNPNIRISEENPPLWLYGFAGDFDHPSTSEYVAFSLKKAPVRPNYLETTLSGNARALWIFDARFRVPSEKDFLTRFLKIAHDNLYLENFLPGFDKSAWSNYSLRFTNGARWLATDAPLISVDVVRGWAVQTLLENHGGDIRRLAVGLDKVAERLAEKYPRFGEWPGAFELGSRGPSFWVEGSTSPMSAVVREEGLFTFAAHAHKSFFSWAEVCGEQWYNERCAQNTGEAVKDIWWDGKDYWIQSPDGVYRPSPTEKTSLYLRGVRKVSVIRPRGKAMNPLEEALVYINEYQRVDGAAPFAGRPHGQVFDYQGDKVLNIARVKPLKPAEEPGVWGPEGNFPTISMLIDGLFGYLPEAKESLLAEYWYFQKKLQAFRPTNGHNLIIMGESSCGKTLLNQRVFGYCAGGYAVASKFLTGGDDFGGELFYKTWWTVDDATNIGRNHRLYSEMVKSAAANPSFRFNVKFRQTSMVEWLGRLCITLNCDAQSRLQLPNLDNSSWDKVSLYRVDKDAVPLKKVRYKHQDENEEDIARECPYFLSWLLALDPKKDAWLDKWYQCRRYGILPFHDPTMRDAVHQSTEAYNFQELLDVWAEKHFKAEKEEEFWEGTANRLHSEMISFGLAEGMRKMDGSDVARHLTHLSSSDTEIVERLVGKRRLWRIPRPKELAKPSRPVEINTSENSPRFGKA